MKEKQEEGNKGFPRYPLNRSISTPSQPLQPGMTGRAKRKPYEDKRPVARRGFLVSRFAS